MTKRSDSFARRDLLKLGMAAGALGVLHGLVPRRSTAEAGTRSDARDRRLLFVIGAHGGASLIDSFLPVLDSEAGSAAATLNCFPERLIEQTPGSAFHCVKLLDNYSFYTKPTFTLGDFVRRHGTDMAVIGHEVSSVNHNVGQHRALSGAGIDRGRTIMETAALRHGVGLPLSNCNMAIDGYAKHGADRTIPATARHEMIVAPQLFGIGTHGHQGVAGAPSSRLLERARKARDEGDRKSKFGQRFAADGRLAAYLRTRAEVSPQLEEAQLVDKLLLVKPDSIDPAYGLKPDALTLAVREALPHLDTDRIQAQVGLSFLLAYHGVSTALTMGLTTDTVVRPNGAVVHAPLSFDYSHSSHRATQGLMWSRTLELADALIALLKSHDYLGDPALGKMWHRSIVYVATEFGRDKTRPSGAQDWGTGHDLNNGSVLLSPLLKGNAVYGGVDPRSGLTYGFDPESGRPDPQRLMTEADVYGILAHALDIEVPGLPRYPSVVRAT